MAKAKIYLYKEGNECVSLTGGWVKQDVTNRIPVTLGNIDGKLYLNSSGNKIGVMRCNDQFNFNKFSSLTFDLKCIIATSQYTRTDIGIWDSIPIYQTSEATSIIGEKITISRPRQTSTYEINGIENGYIGFWGNCYTNNETSIYNVFLETKENVITINSQENDNITFNTSDLGLVTITKIDVLVNGVVSKTYTDEYSNLSYTVDKSLCYIGNNNIEIRVTYSQGDDITETVSEYLTYAHTVENLPTSSNLIQVFDRQELLNNALKSQRNSLKNILKSKNVEVTEEDKMSILIDKVDLLGEYDDSILWLYKDGDECVKATGGFSESYTSGTGATDVNKFDDYIQLSVTGGRLHNSKVNISTINMIDVSPYNKLLCTYSVDSTGSMGIRFGCANKRDTSLESDGVITSYFTWDNSYIGTVTKEIDISNVNTACYINFGIQRNSDNLIGKVYKIWLEK